MITPSRVAVFLILLGVFIRTASFGTWTWKKKNKLGGIVVYLLALAAFAFPMYSMLFRY